MYLIVDVYDKGNDINNVHVMHVYLGHYNIYLTTGLPTSLTCSIDITHLINGCYLYYMCIFIST